MQTFFCRHSSKLDIDNHTFNRLWENDIMAIHYPEAKHGWDQENDCESINPNDYTGSAKKALNALHKISKNGGYVFSVYENQDNYKIGYVEPGTEIEIIKGKWGNKNGLDGRVAILKTLKFKRSIELNPIDAISLTCAQPRQGTLCVWSAAGNRVQSIMEGNERQKVLSDLTPDLQEVLCSEFLRSGIDATLPKLSSLLTPVGRTMKDVDIIGLTNSGKRVLVQVTYLVEPTWKIEKLEKYKSQKNTDLILFCKTEEPRNQNGIIIYSIDEAFKKFTSSETGKSWIEQII